MSESMSRYSIVERLTNSKLELLDIKADLDLGIDEKNNDIKNKEKDLKDWETTVEEDTKRVRIKKQREIEALKDDLDISKSNKEKHEKLCDDKIKEIDNALKSIEEISKTAPTPKEQS